MESKLDIWKDPAVYLTGVTPGKVYRAGYDEIMRSRFNALPGKTVQSAMIREMALYGPDGAACFEHRDLPLVQATVLQLTLTEGPALDVFSALDDHGGSLIIEEGNAPVAEVSEDPFRTRGLQEWPRGRIDQIELLTGEIGVTEVWLRIGEDTVVLRSGEVYEGWAGELTVRTGDESVLIFFSEADRRRMVFDEPAYTVIYPCPEGGQSIGNST